MPLYRVLLSILKPKSFRLLSDEESDDYNPSAGINACEAQEGEVKRGARTIAI